MKYLISEGITFYKSLSAPVKATFWYAFGNIVQNGIVLLTTPIFTRLLTTQEYGVFTVYMSWYQIIAVFATLNLSAGVYNNGLLKYESRRDEFTSSMQGLSTTITLFLFIVYLSGINFWSKVFELSPLMMSAMFVELLFVPAYLFWSAKERFSYRFRGLIVATMIIALGSPVVGIIAILTTSHKAEARVLSHVMIEVCVGLALYIYNMRCGQKFFDKEIWKFALGFNLPLIPHYLSHIVLSQADRIMISRMVGTGEAAIYGVAYTVSMMMILLTNAINSSFIPYIYKELKNKEYQGIKKTANSLLFFVGTGCILVMTFAPEIIKIFAAKEYSDAIWVMPPIVISVYFIFLYFLYAVIEFFYENTRFVTIASCTGAIFNIVLNYLFIHKYGYYAAGYTTLACYIILALVHYLFYKKVVQKEKLPIKEIYDIRFVLLFSLILLLAMMGIVTVYRHILIRYITALVLLVILARRRNSIIKSIKGQV